MPANKLSVQTYVAIISILAVGIFVLMPWPELESSPAIWNAVGSLLALALLAELFSTGLSIGNATTAVSFVPYIAAILLLGPTWAMIVAGMAELIAETIIRRKPLLKVVHNTAKETMAVGTAGFLYVWLGASPAISEFTLSLPAFAVAATSYFVLSNGAVATAISLTSDVSLSETWGRWVGRTIVYDLFASSLALLLAFLYVELQIFGLLLVIIPLFFVRHSNHVNRQLEQTNRDLLELMVKAIEARDPYTSGHSQRVAKIAATLAREVGLGFKEVEAITTAALLHDVGKIYEDFAPILRKQSRLTDHEKEMMQTHPVRGAELVTTISNLRGYVEQCVRHHHENYDGSGYPEGLAGEEIPLGARIIMIADTADAMTTDRPYRRALGHDKVVRELDRYAGKQFDPRLSSAFRESATIRAAIANRTNVPLPSMGPKSSRWRVRVAK